jgi:PAS domain S-box-containing protein
MMNAEQLPSHLSSILIVDDEPDICLALEGLLRHAGYTVRSVMTGREALHEAEQRSFGAVILDLGLPDLSGFAVLRGLEELDPLLPVIVLTASTQDSHTVESLRRGAAAYVTKPYNSDALKLILRQAVDARKLALKMHRAEHALSAREEQFRHVIHAVPDGILLADGDGKIVSWNTAAERFFGHISGEILGQPLTTIMPTRYREDLQRRLEHAKVTGVSPLSGTTIELHGLRKDGSEFPIEISLGIWSFDGQMFSCVIVRDITQRKEADAKLLLQQIEQQVLLDLIPAMVWYKDTHNRIVRANRHAAESINKTVAEVEGQSTFDLYPEEAEQYYHDDLQVIGSGMPKLGIVELYQSASGEKRWVQTDKVPYRDPQGNVIGVLVFAQNITERKQAEAALQESERQYRRLMEEASDGIVVIDLNGYFKMANSKVCKMFGYTREELLQLHVRDTYIPAEQALAQQSLEQIRADMPVRFNRLLQRKDGTVIPVEISAVKMSNNRYFESIRALP